MAPGPVWTPLNPADQGMTAEKADSSFITGIVLSEMGGETTGG